MRFSLAMAPFLPSGIAREISPPTKISPLTTTTMNIITMATIRMKPSLLTMSSTVQIYNNTRISLRSLSPKLFAKSVKTDKCLGPHAKAALGPAVFALRNLIQNLYTTTAAQPEAVASQNKLWTLTAFARLSFTPPPRAHQTASTPCTSLVTLRLVIGPMRQIQMLRIWRILMHTQVPSRKSAVVARSLASTPNPRMAVLLRTNLS